MAHRLLGFEWRGAPKSDFSGTTFWMVFGVFFRVATGVMTGANMSGYLAGPRRSIPRGTLADIGLSAAVYAALAVWLSRAGTAKTLAENDTFMIDASLAPGVLAERLSATISSALSSRVGAPPILVAQVQDRVLPDVAGGSHIG